ncbi:hypothetical protein Tco_1086819, partial [Tanacetum coccineum]
SSMLYILPAASLVSAGSSMFLLVVILPAASLVSAGSSLFLLVGFSWVYYGSAVILPAGRMVSAGWSMVLLVAIFPAGRMVSAGWSMVLLVVIVPAGFFVPAGSYGLCCWFRVHAVVYAVITSIHAAGLVCAGGIMFLLADLFLLVVTCFYCAQLNIAGWLVYATSHLVSADWLLLDDFIPAGLKNIITNGGTPVQRRSQQNRLLGEGKRFRGLHRYPQLLGPLSIKLQFAHNAARYLEPTIVATIDA